MKILIISPQFPLPLIDGGKKAVFYPIKYLSARGHEIHLACLADRINPVLVKELEKYCTLDIIPHSKKLAFMGALLYLLSPTSYDLRRFHNRELLDKILNRLRFSYFDVIQLEGIHAAYYGLAIKQVKNIPIIIRLSNVHSVNLKRFADHKKNPLLKAYLRIEAWKVQRYETVNCEKFDLNLTISRHDQDIVQAQNPRNRCEVVPAGVDCIEFSPVDREEDNQSVLWIGALQWQPNQDSFWWFFREIVPAIVEKVPNVLISVVGSNPPKSILNIQHPNVKVLGFVEDVKEYIQRAQVCVVPLRIGSGIRLKLLEMFAMKKAIVSTYVGCEGLNVRHGEHLLIADEPDTFANAVIKLLYDPSLRAELGQKSLSYVKRYFDWNQITLQYERVYNLVLNERRIFSTMR